MTDRDVNLVIKAKEQAKKAVVSVTEALGDLKEIQDDVGQSAKKTDGLLGRLKDELTALDREARGLAAFNRVADQLDKAAGAVGRLDAQVGQSTRHFDKMQAAHREAAASSEQLRRTADEARKAYDAQRATLAGLSAEQKKDAATVREARTERDRLKRTLTEANAALRAAETNERRLADALHRATQEAEQGREALADANAELSEIAAMAKKASSALGGVEATQEAVAAASARATADMERLNKAMADQGGPVRGATTPSSAAEAAAVYRQQVAAVAQAKTAWREAQAEANRLGTAIRNTAAPTREMQTAFLLAQAASRAAKTEYIGQGVALNKLRGDLQAARTTTEQQAQATRETAAATDRASGAQVRYGAAVRSTAASTAAATNQNYRLRDSFRGIYGESRQAMNMFQRMRAEVLSLTSAHIGLYAAISQLGRVVDVMRSVEQARNRLGVAFQQNDAVVGSEMKWLEEQADRLKFSFAALAAEYGKFAFSARNAGLSIEDLHTVFLGVAEGARVMGLSMDEVQGILKALDQIMSKGKVQAEELRGQLGDRLSGSFRLFAEAIGVTTAELDKMMEQGEVVANRSQMVAFGQRLRDVFGPQLGAALENTTSEISRFDAMLERAARQVGQGGFWDGLGEALRDLNDWFASDEGEKFFTNLGRAAGRFVQILPGIVKNIDTFVFGFQVLASVKVGQVVLDLMGRMGGLGAVAVKTRMDVAGLTAALSLMGGSSTGKARAGLLALAGTMTALRGVIVGLTTVVRGLWAAIGGLPGVIVTGLTFLLTSLVGKWATGVDRATKALEIHQGIVDRVSQAYVDAKGDVDDWRKSLESVSELELRVNTDEMTRALEDARKQALKILTTWESDGLLLAAQPDKLMAIAAFRDIVAEFRRGKISAAEFSAEIERLAKANPRLDRFAEQLKKVAVEGDQSETALAKNEAVLRVLAGTATDADRALLDLTDNVKGLSEAAADTSAIDRYTAALKRMGETVPEIRLQEELTERRDNILKGYQEAVTNALRMPDVRAMVDMLRTAQLRRDQALAALGADRSGSMASYIDRLIGVESGGSNTARARTSSAYGASQFTEGTWLETYQSRYPERFAQMSRDAVLALRSNPQLNREMTELLTQQNEAILAGAGFAATDTNRYLAHFLGASDAVRVLGASRDTPIDQVVNARSRAANPSVFRNVRTAGDMIDWSASKMSGSDTEVAFQRQLNELIAQRRQTQIDYNQSLADANAERAFEIEQLLRSEREQQIMVALRQAEADAVSRQVTLTDEQRAAIRESVGAHYDAQAAIKANEAIERARLDLARQRGEVEQRAAFIAREAREAGINLLTEEGRRWAEIKGLIFDVVEAERLRREQQSAVDSGVSNLRDQQQAMMEQIQFYRDIGEDAIADTLTTRLDAINAQLLEAIDNALAFYRALDPATNPQAAATILGLENTQLALTDLGNRAIVTGKQINDMIAQGGADAFDRFFQSVGEGINVFRALGDAVRQFAADFLRQIAQMIIQQTIFNLVSGMFGGGKGGGGGIGGWVSKAVGGVVKAPVKHDGGMVGEPGPSRNVWAESWASIKRFHNGGVIGLKSGEVPIVAERGEEVLTMDDPRHALNGGGARPVVNMKNINLFDPADMLNKGLSTEEGVQSLLNVISENPRAFRAAMG